MGTAKGRQFRGASDFVKKLLDFKIFCCWNYGWVQIFWNFFCSSCLNGGTCHDLVNSFRCECALGFEGMNCETRILPCDSNPCLEGGTCVNDKSLTSFHCVCPYGFTGSRCEVRTITLEIVDNIHTFMKNVKWKWLLVVIRIQLDTS